MEERFLEEDFIASLRWLIRAEYPVLENNFEGLALVLANEIFVDLNKDFKFAENRIFAGLNKKFSEKVNLDFGYQLRHLNFNEDHLSHALLFNLNYNLEI